MSKNNKKTIVKKKQNPVKKLKSKTKLKKAPTKNNKALKPSLIQEIETLEPVLEYVRIPRVHFEKVHFVFNSLYEAFEWDNERSTDEQELMDEKFRSIFCLFCHSVGWTEQEYFNFFDEIVANQKKLDEQVSDQVKPAIDSEMKNSDDTKSPIVSEEVIDLNKKLN